MLTDSSLSYSHTTTYENAAIISIPKALVRLTGDLKAALLLSRIIAWSDHSADPQDWFHRSLREWQEETLLTKNEIARCSAHLVKLGLIKIQVRAHGRIPTTHYLLQPAARQQSTPRIVDCRSQTEVKLPVKSDNSTFLKTRHEYLENRPAFLETRRQFTESVRAFQEARRKFTSMRTVWRPQIRSVA